MKKPLDLTEILTSFTGLTSSDVIRTINLYKNKYKKFYKPKKSGGLRAIYHPAQPLKMLQYALELNVLRHLPVSEIAMAYRKDLKSPLRKIADAHAGYAYTVRTDFKDFFPSLRPSDLLPLITAHYTVKEDDLKLIAQILFWGARTLPIGAPSSPTVSNIIMEKFDKKILELSGAIDKNGTVSRYADDIFFSTNKKGASYIFFDELCTFCQNCDHPRLQINREKVLFLSRGTKRVVCGITIASQGWPSIGRLRKTEVKQLLYQMKNRVLPEEKYHYLRGLMAFIKDVEPDLFNRLVIKYGYTNEMLISPIL